MGKGLDKALESLQKRYGAENVSKMKEMGEREPIPRIKTGSLLLDQALGGGYPEGRLVEIYGPESSGKTTLAIHAIAEVQKAGGEVAFVDAEHAFDPFYAEAIGVNVDELIFSQPDNGEEALTIVEDLAKTKEVSLIVVDSVSALLPKSQIEGEIGDANVGKQAKMMSQALPKIVFAAKKADCTVIFINQIRMKIGVMFGSPETTSGGQALKFYASQRIDIRRTGSEKDGEDVVANKVKIKVVKNKVSRPFEVANTFIEFGVGLAINREILSLAIEGKIVKKAGSWFSYGDVKLGQGQSAVLTLMEDNPEMTQEILDKIYKLADVEDAVVVEEKEKSPRRGRGANRS